MIDPVNAPAFRMNDTWQARKSTAANPWEITDFPSLASGGPTKGFCYMPETQSLHVFRRSLTCAHIEYRPDDSPGAVYTLQLETTPPLYALAGSTPPGPTSSFMFARDMQYLPVAYATATGAVAPNSSLWAAGTVRSEPGGRFFWLQEGDTVSVNAVFAAPITQFNVQLAMWAPGMPTAEIGGGANIATSGGSVNIPVGGAGYYAIMVSPATATGRVPGNATVSAVLNLAQGPRFAHMPAPSFANYVNGVSEGRVIGQSVLFQNTASTLNKAGNVVLYQTQPGEPWTSFVLSSAPPASPAEPGADPSYGYDAVAARPQSQNFPAANGAYAWSKPAEPRVFDWRSEVVAVDSVIMSLQYQLDYEWSDLIMATSIPLAGQAGRVTHAMAIEWTTEDTSRPLAVATGRAIDMVMLQDAVKGAPQFSENPRHLAMIHRALVRAGKFVLGQTVRLPATLEAWAPAAKLASELAALAL